jgi:hypothetical protein
MAGNWLLVADAAKQFNRSESAVKRLFYKLQKEKSNLVKKDLNRLFISSLAFDGSSQPNDKVRTTERQSSHDGDRTTERSSSDDTERIANDNNTKMIDALVNELNEKNVQIERLQIDGEQKNRIIAHLQTQLLLNPPANDTERSSSDDTERPNDQANDGDRTTERQSSHDRTQQFGLSNALILFFAVLILIFLVAILANIA